MRPILFRTFTISLLAFASAVFADDFKATSCHIRMDDGTRQEIYFNKPGQSVESRLGTISVPKSVNTLQFDQDVYELNNSGVRSELTGSMRIKTFGMDESDESMLDAGFNKYTQDFDLNVAAELYLRKDQEQGVLTCADVETVNPNEKPGLQTVHVMPAFYNLSRIAYARIESFYGNAQLAKVSVDTKTLIQQRESKFLGLILNDVAKVQTKPDEESLDDLFVRRLKEAKVIGEDSYGRFDLENMSTGRPEIMISSANKNNLEIYKRVAGKEYNVIRNQEASERESLDLAGMLIPGFSAIVKDSTTEKIITLNFKAGKMSVVGKELAQGSARAVFFSASQSVPVRDEQETLFLNSERDEFGETIKSMGQPMAEVKLPSTNKRMQAIKLDEQRVFNELMEAIAERVKKNPPTKEEVEKALLDSGIEKRIDSTQLGMSRLVFAESLRIMFGLEASKDTRINQILEKRIEKMIQAQAKRKDEKLLVKLMFTDRMKVVSAIERELKVSLNVSKLDDLKSFQTKVGKALQSIQNQKQQARVTKRLQAWILKQKVSFNGLLSWTGLDQQTAENRKQVLKLLMGLLDVTQTSKNLSKADIGAINEDFARMLISLTNKG